MPTLPKKTILLTSAFFYLILSGGTHAFECEQKPLTPEEIEKYAIVFEGVVEKVEDPRSPNRQIVSSKEKKYTFRVTQLWKGEAKTGVVQVFAESEYDYITNSYVEGRPYRLGENYLVFGRDDGVVRPRIDTYYVKRWWPACMPKEEALVALRNYAEEGAGKVSQEEKP